MLRKAGPQVAILEVAVVVSDGDRLAREVKHGRPAAPLPCVRFKRSHFLLRHADEHDAFARGKPPAVGRHKLVFTFAPVEPTSGICSSANC